MAFGIDLTLDCANPTRLAEFWKLALGYEDEPPPAPFDRLSAAGATALQEFPGHHVVMADPEGKCSASADQHGLSNGFKKPPRKADGTRSPRRTGTLGPVGGDGPKLGTSGSHSKREDQRLKAYATDGFGEPGTIRDLPTPDPERGQIRVRVAAAGVNPVDNAVLQVFMKDMMEHRFPLVPGVDASGTIDAVGDGVGTWSVGDEVFGAVGKMYFGEGTYAEYTTMSEGSIGQRPSSVAHESAAAIPTAGVTALTLLDALDAKEGAVVLAIGAAGGVGSYFVQLAVQRQVHVIAVSRAENAAYVRSLGAQDVMDYTAENVGDAVAARYENGIDAIADMIGDKEELAGAIAGVKRGGRVASCVGAVDETDLAQRNLAGQNVITAVTTERLDVLASARAAGQLRDPDVVTMPLDQASDALARIAGRHVRGKLVLQVK